MMSSWDKARIFVTLHKDYDNWTPKGTTIKEDEIILQYQCVESQRGQDASDPIKITGTRKKKKKQTKQGAYSRSSTL